MGQPEVDMCVFTVYNKTHYTAEILLKQEAQLSQRDRAMLYVIEDLAKSLKVILNDTAA